MQSGARAGFGLLRNLIQRAGSARQARQLLQSVRQVLPAAEMTGIRGISEPVRRAAVQAGLVDELTAFPSAVSRQGGNVGLMGTRNVPTARQLGQAPKPQFGPGAGNPTPPAGARPTNTLVPQPMQGPRPRGGDLVRTSQPSASAPTTRTQFTEDLISRPSVQGPVRAPVQGPSPAPTTPVQGQLDLRFPAGARSAAEFTTAKGAVRPVGTNVAGQPYRGGPVATERNIETIRSSMAPNAMEVAEEISTRVPQGQGSFFLDNAADVWTDSFRMRPELIRQLPPEVQRRIGTTMMRRPVDAGPIAPRPAFGQGAGPNAAERLTEEAFGRGSALVRSPGGQTVDELMIYPVRVQEIFERTPQLAAAARNAAGGVQTADLASLFADPRLQVAIGAAGLGGLGFGLGAVMDRDRTGETTTSAPPTTPPLFTEDGRTPLGEGAPVIPPSTPSTSNLDPSAPAPVVTFGDRESAVREALQQTAPGAAAVMRAAEPMSPEKYRSIEEYTAAKQAYAQAKPEIQDLMRFMEGQSPTAGGGLAMWAATHPDLAYRYQQQMLKNPAASQQSAETITTTTVTSPIGTQLDTAAVGNAQAMGEAAVAPSQGAFAMVDVTRPQVQPNLQRVQEFIQRQAPRAAMYAGY